MPDRFKMVYHARHYVSALLYLLPLSKVEGHSARWFPNYNLNLEQVKVTKKPRVYLLSHLP